MSGNIVAQPNVTFSLASADADAANAAQKVLIVGQYVTAGPGVTNGSWHQNLSNDGAENDLFGRTSQLAEMIRGFKKIAPQVQLDCVALADNVSGVARVVDISFTGTATAQGTYVITVGSEKLYRFSVPVANTTAGASNSTKLPVSLQ